MRRLTNYLAIFALTAWSLVASGEVVLRTSVTPEQAWVGQRVVLQIDVLSDSGWAQISRFGDIDLSGAYMMRTDSQGTRLQETIDGVAYSGQRYELSIYPQVAGAVEVPAIHVEVSSKVSVSDAAKKVQQNKTPLVTITSKLPPGAEEVRGLISTTRFTAEQKWESINETAKVGDAFKRTVILQAEDVSAMAFAPLQHADIPGLGIYPAEPTLKDSTDRGSLSGTRTEVVTYVLERAGEVLIPDIVFDWWDVTYSKLRRVDLPGRLLNVAAGPAGASDTTGVLAVGRFETRDLLLLAMLFLVPAYVLWHLRKGISLRWARWRKRRKASEGRYFRLAVKSIRSKDASAALRDLMRWFDRINASDRPARIEPFMRQYGDAQLQQATADLNLSLVNGDEIMDAQALYRGLSAARTRWSKIRHAMPRQFDVLPELNRT